MLVCPFTVLVDTREQRPFDFLSVTTGPSNKIVPMRVPTLRAALRNGDYGILGLPSVAIERKSKEDLYGSVGRRANFIGRLERMAELSYAAVVIEAELLDCIARPRRSRNCTRDPCPAR